MFLSVIASTGEVVIVGVVLGADPSRCTYTLIGSPSGRIGAAVPDGGGIIPMIWPAAIRSVHPPALLSPPLRVQGPCPSVQTLQRLLRVVWHFSRAAQSQLVPPKVPLL